MALRCSLSLCYHRSARSHIPIPPKQPSEIGRRVVKTAVPDFKLTDQNGKQFQLSSKRGNLVLTTFIFTTCPDVCPLFTAKFAAIQRALDDRKFKDYWLLSITTDPEHDSAAALKDYANRFKADLAHWSFLTGTRVGFGKSVESLWRQRHQDRSWTGFPHCTHHSHRSARQPPSRLLR